MGCSKGQFTLNNSIAGCEKFSYCSVLNYYDSCANALPIPTKLSANEPFERAIKPGTAQ